MTESQKKPGSPKAPGPVELAPDRYDLTLGPDGVYRVDGRVIPVRDDRAKVIRAVDDRKLVVGVHGGVYDGERLVGAVIGMNVK